MSERTVPTAPPDAADEERPRKLLHTRLMWFVAGSVLNYLLIVTPFHWLNEHHPDWPTWAKAGCSMAVSVSFFFLWNYFINFRSNVRKRDALARYALAVSVMYLLSSSLLTLLKSVDAHMSLTVLGWHADLDVVATQAMLGGLKFFLYHLWVFPPAGLREGDVVVAVEKEAP